MLARPEGVVVTAGLVSPAGLEGIRGGVRRMNHGE